mmetsp:Transcript_23794/g.76478  ORF Transcript_23794/g.76478 Transcript_23794/m.76478 type:complete len:202 (-) Transcript_23794:632-1237(-)
MAPASVRYWVNVSRAFSRPYPRYECAYKSKCSPFMSKSNEESDGSSESAEAAEAAEAPSPRRFGVFVVSLMLSREGRRPFDDDLAKRVVTWAEAPPISTTPTGPSSKVSRRKLTDIQPKPPSSVPAMTLAPSWRSKAYSEAWKTAETASRMASLLEGSTRRRPAVALRKTGDSPRCSSGISPAMKSSKGSTLSVAFDGSSA